MDETTSRVTTPASSVTPTAAAGPATSAPAVADGLRTLIPAGRRPHLVAFSYGAHVGTLAAAQLNDVIADFTIVGCSSLGLPWRELEEFPREHSRMTETERRAVHRRVLEILMFADPAAIDELAVTIQVINIAKTRLRSRQFARSDDIARGLAAVTVPLKSIWGTRDVIASPSLAAVREVLGRHHPELDFRTIPEAGHWVMYEAGDAFNARLIDVLGL